MTVVTLFLIFHVIILYGLQDSVCNKHLNYIISGATAF